MISGFSKVNPSTRYLVVFGILMTLLGCGLRIAAAQDELWLDEITSIRLVSQVHSVGAIFWGINSDNNHFLNSLYLYAIGPDHSFLMFRALSILQGTLAIPVAGLVAGGTGKPTQAALAMALFAVSYPMVHFGSEARGYAGLSLFVLLSTFFAAQPDTFRNRIWLGLSIILGCFSHFLMCPFVMVLMLSVFMASITQVRDWRKAAIQMFERFLVPGLMVGFSGLFILGHMPRTVFHIGDPDTSTWQEMTGGYGIGLEMLAGLSGIVGSQIFIAAAFILFLSFRYRIEPYRRFLYLLTIFAIPVLIFIASLSLQQLSNFSNPRYYIPSVTVALLFMGECLSLGLSGSRRARLIALIALVFLLVGNTLNLIQFYADGRGHYTQAVRDMTARGPSTYGLRVPFGVGTVVDYYAKREGVLLTQVPIEKWCETPPDWWVLGSNPLAPFPRETTRGPAACPQTFDTPVIYSFWGLSGWEWTIYRRRQAGEIPVLQANPKTSG